MASKVFVGKKVVVSGASKGIGFAIAKSLALEGAEVFLLASNYKRLQRAAESIQSDIEQKVRFFAIDLRTFDSCDVAYKEVLKSLGEVDFLINSAGATKSGRFLEQPDDQMIDGFALKFYSAVRLSRLFWPSLKLKAGVVINIVGGFARTPDPNFMVGGAVNAALANFSKALAGQGLRDNINVNWIHPGITATDRTNEIFDAQAKLYGKPREVLIKEKVAEEKIRRLGQPKDVAELVSFLCRPEARHIHGVGIPVDGGGSKGYY